MVAANQGLMRGKCQQVLRVDDAESIVFLLTGISIVASATQVNPVGKKMLSYILQLAPQAEWFPCR